MREQVERLLRHHAAMVGRHGDPRGTILMRKFACRYLIEAPGVAAFRRSISQAANADEFRRLVDAFSSGIGS
jgi:tRNA-dihydrouridine synthase B